MVECIPCSLVVTSVTLPHLGIGNIIVSVNIIFDPSILKALADKVVDKLLTKIYFICSVLISGTENSVVCIKIARQNDSPVRTRMFLNKLDKLVKLIGLCEHGLFILPCVGMNIVNINKNSVGYLNRTIEYALRSKLVRAAVVHAVCRSPRNSADVINRIF